MGKMKTLSERFFRYKRFHESGSKWPHVCLVIRALSIRQKVLVSNLDSGMDASSESDYTLNGDPGLFRPRVQKMIVALGNNQSNLGILRIKS